jgi:subtilisin family serine protease
MTPSCSFLRTWPANGHALGLALGLALTACGGGGGGDSSGGGGGGDGGPPPPPSATVVLVDPTSLSELEELCDEKGATVLGPVEGTNYYEVSIPDGVDVDDFLEDLDDELEVEDGEHDEGVGVPEGGGGTQAAFVDDIFASIATQPALALIGAPTAHARGYDGAGVVVAVIDTGVVASSPALAGHIMAGYDFVDGDSNPADVANGVDEDKDGLFDEGVGHGTFVASLVLAVAPNATIMPLRVLNSDSIGTAAALARAIQYAVTNGADVINFSGGLAGQSLVIVQAAENAKAAGVYVVSAAGNRNLPQVDYPANASAVWAVSAVDATGRKASFASYGSDVDFVAPGLDLLGAHPRAPSGLARWSGTSFSTALVTGAFALLRGEDAGSSSKTLFERLEDTAVPVDALNPLYAGKLGKGRLDLGAATAP